jgi:hypothetical protein
VPGLQSTYLRLAAAVLLLGAGISSGAEGDLELLVSVHDQKMAVVQNGMLLAKYPISTSKYGLGDSRGSYKTPLGRLRVCEKYGDALAAGAVMKGRNATGEIIKVNAPGRDPIVTRILWLEGMEEQNRNARNRAIYIHGTPEESRIGDPVSWGCIRMRSKDVIALYDQVPVGTEIVIQEERLPRLPKYDPERAILIAQKGESTETHSAVVPPPPIASGPSTKVAHAPVTLEAKKEAAITFSGVGFGKSAGTKSNAMSMKSSILLSGLSHQPEATADLPARQLADQRAATALRQTQ